MLVLFTFVFTSFLAGFAAAQNSSSGFDASQIPLSTKNSWCNSQTTICPMLCGGAYDQNTCQGSTLTYTCTCSNGSAPDTSAYTGTLPFFICQQTLAQCIAAHPNDADGQANCKTQNQCGSLNSSTIATVTSSSSSAPSSTSASATATSASASATASAKSMAIAVGQNYGVGLFAAGLFAAIGLFL